MKSEIQKQNEISTDDLDRMLAHVNETHLKEAPLEIMHLKTNARNNTILKIKNSGDPWLMKDSRRNVNHTLNIIDRVMNNLKNKEA